MLDRRENDASCLFGKKAASLSNGVSVAPQLEGGEIPTCWTMMLRRWRGQSISQRLLVRRKERP
jgi:hypothetical protein